MASRTDEIARAAVGALQRRDAATARALLAQVAAEGGPVGPWFLLAQACRLDGDATAEHAALNHVLAAEPRHLGALLMKGEAAVRAGDRRGATAFFEAALAAAPQGAKLPPNLAAQLDRARDYAAESADAYHDHLERWLADKGVGEGRRSARVQESLDIVYGRAQPYLQQPSAFFVSRLPHIPFYEPDEFVWMARIVAAVPEMQAELAAFGADGFAPYVEQEPGRPPAEFPLLDDPDWSALHLVKSGRETEHAARFPATMAALEDAPIPRIRGRSPMILFSLLRAGTHIPPHNGLLNSRLIVHIPLVTPPGCRLRVGNEVRASEAGKPVVFDDSIEHEAWNDSDEDRTILLFEVWRPELDAGEREALTALYEGIDAVRG